MRRQFSLLLVSHLYLRVKGSSSLVRFSLEVGQIVSKRPSINKWPPTRSAGNVAVNRIFVWRPSWLATAASVDNLEYEKTNAVNQGSMANPEGTFQGTVNDSIFINPEIAFPSEFGRGNSNSHSFDVTMCNPYPGLTYI